MSLDGRIAGHENNLALYKKKVQDLDGQIALAEDALARPATPATATSAFDPGGLRAQRAAAQAEVERLQESLGRLKAEREGGSPAN